MDAQEKIIGRTVYEEKAENVCNSYRSDCDSVTGILWNEVCKSFELREGRAEKRGGKNPGSEGRQSECDDICRCRRKQYGIREGRRGLEVQ